MGSARPRDVVEISSSDEEDSPVARKKLPVDPLGCVVKLFADGLVIRKVEPPRKEEGKSDGVRVGEDDDDCVVLDCDPDRAVAVAGGGSSDELEIVAEKGKIACRDFPHSRHSCSNLPFSTTSHAKHCSMCYCFVCDAPAPCNYWGKGLSIDDHCHATDKETKWKTLRRAFKCRSLPASRPEKHQNAAYPTTMSPRQQDTQCQVSVPQSHPSSFSLASQSPLLTVASRNQQRHASLRSSPNVGRTVSAPRASPATRTGRGTRNAHTGQITHSVTALDFAGPAAAEGTNPPGPYQQEDYYEEYTPEDYYKEYTPEDYYEEYIEPPEEAKLYVGNLPYDIDSEFLAQLFEYAGVVEDSEVIYNRGTDQSRGFGFITMSTVEEAEKAVEIFHRSTLDGRLMIVNKAAHPRGARAERPPYQSGSSSFRIYVANLPWQVDDSWLAELFGEYGEVVDAEVVCDYRRKTWHSRGFGFVTMATQEEMEYAIAALNRQILEGRALRVKVAKVERPRRGSHRRCK